MRRVERCEGVAQHLSSEWVIRYEGESWMSAHECSEHFRTREDAEAALAEHIKAGGKT